MTKAKLCLSQFTSNATNQYAGFYMSNTNSNLLYYYSPSNGKTTGHCFVAATNSNAVTELMTIQGDGVLRLGSNSVGMSNSMLCIATNPANGTQPFISLKGTVANDSNIEAGVSDHNSRWGAFSVWIDGVGLKRIHLYND